MLYYDMTLSIQHYNVFIDGCGERSVQYRKLSALLTFSSP
jgi:hypothetical protein